MNNQHQSQQQNSAARNLSGHPQQQYQYLHPLQNNQTVSGTSSVGHPDGTTENHGQSTAMVSAELHLVALKDSFKQAANSLTQLYKQSSQSYNVAYEQGRLDAYEDTLAWLIADQQMSDGTLRHVSVNRFREMIQERISQSQRTNMAAGYEPSANQQQQNSDGQQQVYAGQQPGYQGAAGHADGQQEWSSDQQVSSTPLQKPLAAPMHRIPPSVMSLKVHDSRKRERPTQSANPVPTQQNSQNAGFGFSGQQNTAVGQQVAYRGAQTFSNQSPNQQMDVEYTGASNSNMGSSRFPTGSNNGQQQVAPGGQAASSFNFSPMQGGNTGMGAAQQTPSAGAQQPNEDGQVHQRRPMYKVKRNRESQ